MLRNLFTFFMVEKHLTSFVSTTITILWRSSKQFVITSNSACPFKIIIKLTKIWKVKKNYIFIRKKKSLGDKLFGKNSQVYVLTLKTRKCRKTMKLKSLISICRCCNKSTSTIQLCGHCQQCQLTINHCKFKINSV